MGAERISSPKFCGSVSATDYISKREGDIMEGMQIKLMNPAEVQEFVNIASKYDFDIDLMGGTCYLDAKSFIGVLTQGLKRELTVICQARDDSFDRSIQKFAVA